MAPSRITSVRGPISRSGRGLLGGHKAGRAQERTRSGMARRRLEPLGQAEVGDLGYAVSVSRMLAGFRSRWMMPRRWAYSMASASTLTRRAAADGGCGVPSTAWPGCRPRRIPAKRGIAALLADLVDLDDVGMLELGRGPASLRKRASSSGPECVPARTILRATTPLQPALRTL